MKVLAALVVLALVPLALRGQAAASKTPKVRTLLMFEGKAEEAMEFYVSLVPGSKVLDVQRWGPDEPGAGLVKLATFSLGGVEHMCFDSPIHHPFTFSASTSLFVECDSEAEIDALFARLSDGGEVFMPLDAYEFSSKFAWVGDRFGVSWQISWATKS